MLSTHHFNYPVKISYRPFIAIKICVRFLVAQCRPVFLNMTQSTKTPGIVSCTTLPQNIIQALKIEVNGDTVNPMPSQRPGKFCNPGRRFSGFRHRRIDQ